MHTAQSIITADGSHTLYVPHLNEHYHSTSGAIAEARHVYVETGYLFARQHFNPVSVLEVGFGTGLNCLLTMLEAEGDNLVVHYTGVELYPLDQELLEALNYPRCLAPHDASVWWNRIHREAEWNVPLSFPHGASLLKWHGDIMGFPLPEAPFHLVCFDAFAPEVQPALWTAEAFRRVADMMVKGGVLVTYSSKGAVRRAMEIAGFDVQKVPGPGKKREIVRAIKR